MPPPSFAAIDPRRSNKNGKSGHHRPGAGPGLELARIYAATGDAVIAGCLDPGKVWIVALAREAPNLTVLPLDVLINNAGTHRRKGSVPESVVFSDWEEALRVNTLGPARVSFALRPNLRSAVSAKLVVMSSNRASLTHHWGTAYDYCSSKAAANSVMRGLALNWGQDGIIVLMIHPGYLRTGMGGVNAPMLAEEGARRVKALIDKAAPADNGRSIDNTGHDLPW